MPTAAAPPDPQELVSRLVWFGAVYYCPVAPLPHPSRAGALGEEALGRIRDTRQAGLRRWGNDVSVKLLPTARPRGWWCRQLTVILTCPATRSATYLRRRVTLLTRWPRRTYRYRP